MIDNISIIDQPRLGRLLLRGPSFRYFANPGVQGTGFLQALDQRHVLAVEGHLIDRG
jgi:hypothetical protein